MNANKKQEVVLHYIDKVHATLTETVKAEIRSSLSLIALSIAILALSIGVVSTNNEFSIGGFKLITSFWIIILGCVWVNAILYIHSLSLDVRQDKLKKKIMELYASIGYIDEDEELSMEDSISVPDITVSASWKYFTSKFMGAFYYSITLFIGIIVCLLPIFTEVVAFYRMIALVGWIWWGLVSNLLLLLVTTTYLCIFVNHKMHKNFRRLVHLFFRKTKKPYSLSQ